MPSASFQPQSTCLQWTAHDLRRVPHGQLRLQRGEVLGTATRREAGYPGPSTLGSSALHTDLQIRLGATLTPGSPTVQPSRAQGHARATFGLQRLRPPLPPSSPPPSLTPYSALLHATPPALVHCLLPRASPLQFPSTSVRPEVTRGASSPRAARSTPHPTIVTPSPPFLRRSSQLFSGASRRKSRSSYGSAGTASRPRKRALARRAISPEEGRGVEHRKAHRIPGSADELRRRSLPPGIRRVRGGLESRTTPGTPHRCDTVRYRLANSLAPQRRRRS